MKCKPQEKEVIQEAQKPEKIEISFNIGRRTQKNEAIQRLISRAFLLLLRMEGLNDLISIVFFHTHLSSSFYFDHQVVSF